MNDIPINNLDEQNADYLRSSFDPESFRHIEIMTLNDNSGKKTEVTNKNRISCADAIWRS